MMFCLTGHYTPAAFKAMGENPNSNRREAAEKLLTAAGGKMVSFYGTVAGGPGVLVIFEADAVSAPAIVATAYASGAFSNVDLQRLLTPDEMAAIRAKRQQIQGSYTPPGH